jgi:hypothetical protein
LIAHLADFIERFIPVKSGVDHFIQYTMGLSEFPGTLLQIILHLAAILVMKVFA